MHSKFTFSIQASILYLTLINIPSLNAASTKCNNAGKSPFLSKEVQAVLKKQCQTFAVTQKQAIKDQKQRLAAAKISAPIAPHIPKKPYSDAARRLRKDLRTMTDTERRRFFAAVQKLKSSGKYDSLGRAHLPTEGTYAHYGAAFLPWHREYLHRYEEALREIDSKVTIPYWDSSLDQGLPDPKDSIIWTDTFVGGNSGNITSGPFANWRNPRATFSGLRLGAADNWLKTARYLRRNVGSIGALVSPAVIKNTLFKGRKYEDFIWSAGGGRLIEDLHGVTHVYVGGHMQQVIAAPVDPIFFMHHAFIDCLWEEFRQTRQNQNERVNQYTTNPAILGDNGHKPDSPMLPWRAIQNKHGLRNHYREGFYRCAPRPTCNRKQTTCGPYLFCDVFRGRCLPKIKAEGNCKGFEGVKSACQSGYECRRQKCVISSVTPPKTTPKPRCTSNNQCSGGQVCCEGDCVRAGSCQSEVRPGGRCSINNKCTSGYRCCHGKCQKHCFVEFGGLCSVAKSCSQQQVCCKGRCRTTCNSGPGDKCSNTFRCTRGFRCCGGTCLSTCQVPPRPQRCSMWRRCSRGLRCCNGQCKRSCQITPRRCNRWRMCNRGFACCSGICQRSCHVKPGGRCGFKRSCTSWHLCCRGRCTKTCHVAPGGQCSASRRCTSGHTCCKGRCSRSCQQTSRRCNFWRRCQAGYECCNNVCSRNCYYEFIDLFLDELSS